MKIMLFLLTAVVSLTACSSKQSINYDNRVKLSSELARLIDDSFKGSKTLSEKPVILLMHMLYDSLGNTKIVVTPTSSATLAKMHSPDFVSKIGNRVVFIYASNGKVLTKTANYLARANFIADSVLPVGVMAIGSTKGAVYIDDIKRISFKNNHPYLDYSSNLLPPLASPAPLPYPPISMLGQ